MFLQSAARRERRRPGLGREWRWRACRVRPAAGDIRAIRFADAGSAWPRHELAFCLARLRRRPPSGGEPSKNWPELNYPLPNAPAATLQILEHHWRTESELAAQSPGKDGSGVRLWIDPRRPSLGLMRNAVEPALHWLSKICSRILAAACRVLNTVRSDVPTSAAIRLTGCPARISSIIRQKRRLRKNGAEKPLHQVG